MAIYANLSIDQGADFSAIITVVATDNVPLDLSAYTAAGQIRRNYTSSAFTPLTASVLAPAIEGQIRLSLTKEQTLMIKPGRYVYDAIITDGTHTIRVVEGQVEVSPGVTRE